MTNSDKIYDNAVTLPTVNFKHKKINDQNFSLFCARSDTDRFYPFLNSLKSK